MHEFFHYWSNCVTKSCGKHHYLFLVRSCFENLLYVASHIKRFEHLITLVENKVFNFAEVQNFFVSQLHYTTRCTNDNMRYFVLQLVLVCLNRNTTIEYLCLHSR